jgi:hypothetical protein
MKLSVSGERLPTESAALSPGKLKTHRDLINSRGAKSVETSLQRMMPYSEMHATGCTAALHSFALP